MPYYSNDDDNDYESGYEYRGFCLDDRLVAGLSSLRLGGGGGAALNGADTTVPTSAISFVSHAHGRQRRQERSIEKRQLQQAIKYGVKSRANPGRDGRPRWKYTYQGIVYVTDESSRHEVTCWKEGAQQQEQQQQQLLRQQALQPAAIVAWPPPYHAAGSTSAAAAASCHVVVVVDASGSMRKHDVPGAKGCVSRISAVYDCVARDLVAPQLQLGQAVGATMSLIEMRDTAAVCISRQRFGDGLLLMVKHAAARAEARSHGNYLPALRAAAQDFAGIDTSRTRLFLVFLSDGAPSDHTFTRRMNPEAVRAACVDAVRRLGMAAGGSDRVAVHTVAFGPPGEDFAVLQEMARASRLGSFQKQGLSALQLRTAFSTISSSLSSLLTDLGTSSSGGYGGGGGGRSATLRPAVVPTTARLDYDEGAWIRADDGWLLYMGATLVSRVRYNALGQQLAPSRSLRPGAGLAVRQRKFSEGAERAVFQATELFVASGGYAFAVGPRLVAKQPRYLEQLTGAMDFQHETFCRVQAEAQDLALKFNQHPAVRQAAWQQVAFLDVVVWRVLDTHGVWGTGSRVVDMVVEQELEGRLIKWNNNNGLVAHDMGGIKEGAAAAAAQVGGRGAPNPVMGAIAEDDEDEYEDDEDEGDGDMYSGSGYFGGGGGVGGRVAGGGDEVRPEHVPQAFSHYTWWATGGTKLVCDLQGTWTADDGFTLTDPVIHHVRGRKLNGATDKGAEGVRNFFRTHTCNALCRRLGLGVAIV
ncbi:hypothetical protein HYH02_004259 [Chlamydomonas schloesseri]|uniref:Alpha-type protein kinase domain-containing protein n=1 Tax=Chlamydomonas schloesseri TaxID=2026947 RepID=A0A835WNL3_9CHLO|nr:hypothetical protein HYH02_004259 [Chlamydomonas schloesseri]|eukprot:KAG2450987.1 hypothetical protein HYH02_004259 [Chlamydomonas schloesseri]